MDIDDDELTALLLEVAKDRLRLKPAAYRRFHFEHTSPLTLLKSSPALGLRFSLMLKADLSDGQHDIVAYIDNWVKKYEKTIDIIPLLPSNNNNSDSVNGINVVAAPITSKRWRVRKPDAFKGYGEALYLVLVREAAEGRSRPTPTQILQLWREQKERPPEILKILNDSIEYLVKTTGAARTADLEAIGKAMQRMTETDG